MSRDDTFCPFIFGSNTFTESPFFLADTRRVSFCWIPVGSLGHLNNTHVLLVSCHSRPQSYNTKWLFTNSKELISKLFWFTMEPFELYSDLFSQFHEWLSPRSKKWEGERKAETNATHSWAWRHTWQSRQKFTVNRPRSKQWFLYLVSFFLYSKSCLLENFSM